MDRRNLLKMLGLAGVLLFSAAGRAFSKIRLAAGEAAEADSPPALTGARGLPSDWRFVAPRNWQSVDASLKARLNSALRDSSPIDLGGIQVTRAGKIEIGKLDPTGAAVDLPASLDAIVQPADEALNLEVLNRDFNPFLRAPVGAGGKPLVGPFQKGGELYEGKTLLPVRMIVSGLVDAAGAPRAAVQPFVDSLSEAVVLRTPAHQYRLGDGLGNRVVFYGEDEINGEIVNVDHAHIDRIVFDLAKRNLRLVKQMVHFDKPAQGGRPDDIIADGVAGSTHVGGFSEGYDIGGDPMSVKSDWPSNYGRLGNSNRTYNAHLHVIDYEGGVEDRIPPDALRAYYRNADMWDCCAAIVVPFADKDPDPHYRDYMYNPLEVYDQQSARDVAAALTQLDEKTFFAKHGAFYCAEGQYVVANLGPQEDTLLKKSRFGATPFGKMIDTFQSAPGYQGMDAEERQKNPSIGWDYLAEIGPERGGISTEQQLALQTTDRYGVTLDWIPEDVKGWQAYRPKDREGLIARPMTVATLAWGLLRLYMPRDAIAQAVAADMARAYAQGGEEAKDGLKLLLQGADPTTPAGQVALAGLAAKAATGLLLGLLSSDQVRATLLFKGGFTEITNDVDKAKVLAAYEAFLNILQDADYSTQASIDEALAKADEKLGKLVVTRNYFNRATQRNIPAKSSVMKYAAPPCFGMWSQQPFLAGTSCVRYVATAMHLSARKNPPA
jgi:hypothetical protein